ncbi:MAG TPA: transglutaminase domain-containing protein [Thermoanaerobaculia bacterium]|nr:transglutaminase domain-containing protein [Thermoanaerobaculia bacterium]
MQAPPGVASRVGKPASGLAALAVVGSFLVAGPIHSDTAARAVEGIDRAVAVLPGEARAESYRNEGYRLRRVGDSFEVVSNLAPIESSAPFHQPKGIGADAVERLARQLARGSRDQYEAVSRILGWVARSIRYELDRDASQTAEAVLARGRGYCTGVARLTVALLRGVGLEAREVAGFVVDDDLDWGVSGDGREGSGYHRWIEVRYPDRGWVFSDPLRFHHFVPASYVRLASEVLDLSPGDPAGAGRSLARERRVEIVDTHALAPSPILARRNRPRQVASTLRVVVEPAASVEGVVWLEGVGRVWTQPLVYGEGTFVGLAAGEYELRVETTGGGRLVRQLRMAAPVRSVVSLQAPAVPVAAGR